MQRLILLVTVLFALGAQARLLGTKECTYGPSYWCGSLKNAKSCEAVNHCISSVWESQVLPADNDAVCSICKDMVMEARQQLENKQFLKTITGIVRQSCTVIPIKEVQKDCIKLADEYIPEFVDMLVSQMNPQIICATVGFCNSVHIDKVFKQMEPIDMSTQTVGKSENNCQDCRTFVTDVKQVVATHSREEVLNKLLAICGRLDTLSDGCRAIVEVNFPLIYDYMNHQLDSEEACDKFGFCSKLFGASLASLPPTSDNAPCDFCEGIIQHWKTAISQITLDEFKQMLEGLCQQTGPFRDECVALSDQYYAMLYDLLVSEIQPKEICEAVGICGRSSVFNNDFPVWTLFNMKPSNTVPMVPLEQPVDMNTIVGRDEINSYNIEKEAEQNAIKSSSFGETGIIDQSAQGSNECIMCEFAMHYLQNILQNRPTREEIITEVDQLCSKLPHSLAETCQDYVDAYADELIQLLILEIDPTTICPLLHMCPGSTVTRDLSANAEPKVPCVMCEFAMTQLDEMLKDKKTEDEVQHALDTLCSVMPHSVSADCRDFVDQYTPQLIDMLINDLTPDQVCQQLGLCDSTKKIPELSAKDAALLPISRMFIPSLSKPVQMSEMVLEQSTGCAICEFVIHELDKFLVMPAVEVDIMEAVDKVCLVLPHTLRSDCVSFINSYAVQVISLLVHEVEPEVVCSAIRLCKETSMGLPVAMVRLPANKCKICHGMVDWVAATDKAFTINQMITDFCGKMPQESEAECDAMARQNGASVQPLLAELETPKKVCQVMEQCPSLTPTQNLLGSKKCTWGPTYWCQSEWHAASCGATQHCTERVWGKDPSQN